VDKTTLFNSDMLHVSVFGPPFVDMEFNG